MCMDDMDLEYMAKVVISKADQKKILADKKFCDELMYEIGAKKSSDGNWLVDFDEIHDFTYALEEFGINDYSIEDADESYIPDDYVRCILCGEYWSEDNICRKKTPDGEVVQVCVECIDKHSLESLEDI